MSMDKTKYAEVNSGDFGIRWEIAATEKNGMKFTKDSPDNVKEGYYLGAKEIPGKDGKVFKVHSVQTLTKEGVLGDTYAITGGAVFDDKMKDVAAGSFVGIEYLGRAHKKGYDKSLPWSQTNSYHNWFVGVNPQAPAYVDAQKKSGVAPVVTPEKTQQQAAAVTNGAGAGGGLQPNNNFVSQADDDLPF